MLPSDIADPDVIMDLIKMFNDVLMVDNWPVVKVGELNNGFRETIFIINAESLPLL